LCRYRGAEDVGAEVQEGCRCRGAEVQRVQSRCRCAQMEVLRC